MTILPLFLLLAAEANVINDTLDEPPQSPWTWVREDAEHWRVEGGTLQIRALAGTLWKTGNNAKNVLVRPWPAEAGEEAVVSVTVAFAPERGGEQAGVMLYSGDDDYVKLVYESLEGKRWVVMGREEKADGQQVAKVEEPAGKVTLRLTRRGNKIVGSYVTEGQGDVKAVGECDLVAGDANELKLALIAHGGPPAAADARRATFANFSVSKLTE